VDVLIILVFVSLVLVAGALVLLFTRISGGDFEHGDRLSLLPLEPERRDRELPPPHPPEEVRGEPRPS
jgi:hypothetical protein